MDSRIFALFVICLGLHVTYCQAQCDPGQVSANGKCFDRRLVARNLEMSWRWNYFIQVDLTQEVETQLADFVTEKFVEFSEGLKSYDLRRTFCPDTTCSGLQIEIAKIAGSERVGLEFYLEDIQNLIRENPALLSKDALQRAVNDQGKFNLGEDNILESDGVARSYTLHSIEEYCPPGSEKIDQNGAVTCGVCAPGYYYDHDTELCLFCPIGSYQQNAESFTCIQCVSPQTTTSVGSTHPNDCKTVCLAGEYLDVDSQACTECAVGTYQPSPDQQSCLNCSDGQTTYGTASVSDDSCVDTCAAGYALSEDGDCNICPKGTYLSNPSTDRSCNPCPTGMTTLDEGSGTINDCDALICGAGEYRVGISPGVCTPCPRHTYKDDVMEDCVSCGDPENWRTETEGATSFDQCRFYCPAGHYISESGSACEPCRHDTYKPGTDYYATECNPCPESAPKTASTASVSLDACKYARCDRGYEISATDTLQCSVCDYGFYQPHDEPIFHTCLECPENTKTRVQAAISSTQCEEYCESGYEQTPLGSCIRCEQGYYKDNTEGIDELFGRCQMCDIDYITPSTGSTSSQECNIRNCTLGYYRDTQLNSCSPCTKGSYQDELYQTVCKQCPTEFTTTADGSTSMDDCSVPLERRRIAFRIKFDMEWDDRLYDKDSTLYEELKDRIIAQVEKALLDGVAAYRENLKLRVLAPGSIDAHLVAKFYNGDPNVISDLERTLNEALSNGQISDAVVDGFDPLPIDPREGDPYAYGYTDRDFCPYGQQYNYVSGQCERCAIGWYQLSDVADLCLQCPQGSSTRHTGTVGSPEDVCLLICPAGQEARNGRCQNCLQNYFKSSESMDDCMACPGSLITVETGVTTEEDCIAACPPGEFSNANKQCDSCPLHTYNEDRNQIACTDCPQFLYTRGTGSTSINDCLATTTTTTTMTTTTATTPTTATSTVTTPTSTPSTSQSSSTQGTTSNDTVASTEKSVAKEPDNNNLMYIVIGSVAGGVLIVLIITIGVCVSRRRTVTPPPSKLSLTSKSSDSQSTASNNNNVELPMTGIDNQTYGPQSEDSFIVTTPRSPSANRNKGTTSSIPDMLAPEPPRSITTVNIGDDGDEIRHRNNAPISTGFDPIPDSFSMPTIRNPLLQQDPNGAVFINGVATLPPAGSSWIDHPPPYTENATEPDRRGRKKKNKKQKNRKHVLIDTQRNMVHTFKSTNSDTSSTAYASPSNLPQGPNKHRPGLGQLDTLRSDASNVYETIPGDQ